MKHSARFMNNRGYAFNLNKKGKANESAPVDGVVEPQNKKYIKQRGLAVTYNVPGYKERCTSFFTE